MQGVMNSFTLTTGQHRLRPTCRCLPVNCINCNRKLF
jgi:hypothetical protein